MWSWRLSKKIKFYIENLQRIKMKVNVGSSLSPFDILPSDVILKEAGVPRAKIHEDFS